MKYILSLLSVCVLAFGLSLSAVQQAEAGSRKKAAIAGAIIGGAIAGAAISRHHRRHDRDDRRYHQPDRYYDNADSYGYGYGYEPSSEYRRCHREHRCYWKPASVRWYRGERHYRPARKKCRRVQVCR